MQQLISQNGGMPLYIDHLIFMQEAYAQAIKGLLSAYTGDFDNSIILSGCVPTETSTGVYNFTEGFVLLNGEVRFLRAQTGVSISNPLLAFFTEFDQVDPSGDFVFEDGVTRSTFEQRDVQVQTFTTTPTVPAIPAINQQGFRLEDKIPSTDFTPQHDVLSYQNSWSPITSGGLLPVADEILVQKVFNKVSFRGQISGGAVSTVMFNVSSNFRPSVQGIDFICPYGTDGLAKVQVQASGNVRFTAIILAPSSGGIIDLSNISFTVK